MPSPKRVVILGGGYGGAYTFKYLQEHFRGDPLVNLQLVTRSNYFVSTPFLHEVATGGVLAEHVAEPLRKVFRGPENLLVAEVKSVNLSDKVVETSECQVPYDYLVLALGSETNYRNVPGAREHTLPLKTLEDAARLKNHLLAKFEEAANCQDAEEIKSTLSFVVVGGGATGVELAAEMADLVFGTMRKYYPRKLIDQVRITLVNSGDDLLPNFARSIRVRSKNVLRKKKIEIKFGLNVVEVRAREFVLSSGEVIKSDTVVWAAGVSPSSVPITPEPKKERGRIAVNQFLQIPDHPEVFALGDQASFHNQGSMESLPMLAQVAHKQAEGVAVNLARLIEGKPLVTYSYKHMGDLVSLGEWVAAGEVFGMKIFGHISWFFWRGVYLAKLLSPSKRFEVLIDWVVDLFSPRDISRFE